MIQNLETASARLRIISHQDEIQTRPPSGGLEKLRSVTLQECCDIVPVLHLDRNELVKGPIGAGPIHGFSQQEVRQKLVFTFLEQSWHLTLTPGPGHCVTGSHEHPFHEGFCDPAL